MMSVTYKTKRTGTTLEQVNIEAVKAFAAVVLADHVAMPDQYAGEGRKGRTPFKRTGTLVGGLEFKPASRTGVKAGLVGTIRAPMSRFASGQVRDKFVERLHKLWATQGIGYSKAGL